jgi:hypothetical protein
MNIQNIKKAHAALYARQFQTSNNQTYVSVPIAELSRLHIAIMAAQDSPTGAVDRTAIAARLFAVLITADLNGVVAADGCLAQSAVELTDALLRELAAPASDNKVPNRDPDDSLADRVAALDADTFDNH